MKNLYNIYEIDTDIIWNDILMRKNAKKDYVSICKHIINNVRSRALKGLSYEKHSYRIDNNEDFLLLFYKENDPKWLTSVIDGMGASYSREQVKFTNRSSSYLLLSIVDESVYATTGGYASSYIMQFIVKDFGLFLLTKLFKEEDFVIKETTESQMNSTKMSQTSLNRNYTTFYDEKDYTNILKKINARSTKEILKKLDLEDDEENKNYNIISGYSLNIRKQITFEEYKNLLGKIHEINTHPSTFAISYFSLLKDYNITNTTAFKKFIERFLNELGSFTSLEDLGEEHILNEIKINVNDNFKYYQANSFILSINGEYKFFDNPPEFIDLFKVFIDVYGMEKFNKTNLETFFKKCYLTVQSSEEDDYVLNNVRIIDIIDYSFSDIFETNINDDEIEERVTLNLTVYLNDGIYYVLSKKYKQFIQENFSKLYLKSNEKLANLYRDNGLNIVKDTETDYNNEFKNTSNKNIVHSDQILIDNIEICDLIVFDEKTTYLICNKRLAQGNSSRDLLNQLLISALLVKNDPDFKNKYYDKLQSKGKLSHLILTKEEFHNKLNKIIYVAAYTSSYIGKNSKQTYIKLLSLNMEKELKKLDFEFYTTSPLLFVED